MEIKLSSRVIAVKPSPTIAVTELAAKLRAQGRDVIGLGAGEPDFDTPEHIKQAALEAMRAGQTKYTAADGTPALKQAIVDKFARDNGLEYALDQVLVSNGAKHSLYNLCQALLEPGDEAIIPAPYWVSYPDIAILADARPVFVNAGQDQHFKIAPEQLRAAISANTKMLFLNSPSNPTGAAYTRAELEALAEVLLGAPQVIIASDDIYEHVMLGDRKFDSILDVCPDLIERTVVLNGVSKAYSMTGWRIGYAGGPKPLIQAMKKIQSQSTSNPSSISQAAAVAALNGDQSCVATMRKAFNERHRYLVGALNEIDGFDCLPCDGTFYCFPNVEGAIGELSNVEGDVEFAQHLLEAGVALVPGSAFGLEGYVRISFATSMENLRAAVARIDKAVND